MTVDALLAQEQREAAEAEPSVHPDSRNLPHYIGRLNLHCFRNYTSLQIEAGPRHVVLYGENGAGKTNVLEAISLLSPGRGFRKAQLRELDCQPANLNGKSLPVFPSSAWAVSATVVDGAGEWQIGTGRDAERGADAPDKRLVKVDGVALKSQNQLAEYLSIAWLIPQMDPLFSEGASARRKFLDRLAYSFMPSHLEHVMAYEYAMRERNRLFEQRVNDRHWLESLEAKMAAHGVAIACMRNEAVERLNASILQATAVFPKAVLSLQGLVENWLAEGASSLRVEEQFREWLATQRQEDRLVGRALGGVHRTELKVHHAEKGREAEQCSTGEQKAMLVSILLAQARARAEWRGSGPILLLDEVVAHLDETRRGQLFEELDALKVQAWLTGTDKSLFKGLQGSAQFLRVQQGKIDVING
jgi:DNA replication and repair protein RecF